MQVMTKEDIEQTIGTLNKYSGPLQAIIDAEIHFYKAWLNYYRAMERRDS